MQVEDVVVISDADAGAGPKSSTRAEFKEMLHSSSSRQAETGEEEEEAGADQTTQVEEAAMSAHATRTDFYLRMSEVCSNHLFSQFRYFYTNISRFYIYVI